MHKETGAMERLAQFIVDKRRFIIFAFIFFCICSIFTSGLVKVESDVTAFLPDYTETRQGVNAMSGEFVTFGTAKILLKDTTPASAADIAERIEKIDGVSSAEFDKTKSHYNHGNCLITVTFTGQNGDEKSIDALNGIKDQLSKKSGVFIYSEVDSDVVAMIGSEMLVVGIIAVIIVFGVLLLASRSFAEVPVLLLTFGAAALLNLGTNFFCGTISFVANAVTLILQLALAIDYAVILCHRFSEERQNLDYRDAMVAALAKAIPEISASSLTTIGGLVAMCFMEFGMGYDLGIVLIKAIILSMLSVFLLMPGLLMIFAGAIDKTKHRSFILRISFVGKFAWKTRKVVPPLFLILAVLAFFGSSRCPLAYSYTYLTPIHMNESQVALQEIRKDFGEDNMLAVIVPTGDYGKEAQMLGDMEKLPGVKSTLGLAGVEVMNGYTLTDTLSAEEFAELAGIDETMASAMFAYYAAAEADAETLETDLTDYEIPLIDLFLFIHQLSVDGKFEFDEEQTQMINDLYDQLSDAKKQLEGNKYSRMLVYIEPSSDTEEAHALVSSLHGIAEKYYGDDVYVTGDATCSRDLSASFEKDTVTTTLLSALFVVIIIILTFRSVGLAVLLIAVIQGSIWINFSVPYLTDSSFFFVAYLIVSSIQMGANIDYAIVVSNRYVGLRSVKTRREAIIEAMNGAFPTLVTSGSILACAGLLIGFMSSETTTSAIGLNLGRGTLISLFLVMFVLPQLLLWGDRLIDRTKLSKKLHFSVPPRFRDDFESLAKKTNSV